MSEARDCRPSRTTRIETFESAASIGSWLGEKMETNTSRRERLRDFVFFISVTQALGVVAANAKLDSGVRRGLTTWRGLATLCFGLLETAIS